MIDEAGAARQVVSRGWVTEAQMKDALYERVMNPESAPLLKLLVSRGWLTKERAAEVGGEPALAAGEEAFAEAVSLLETGRLKPALSRMREALALPWRRDETEPPAACMLRQLDEEIATVGLALEGNPRYVAGMRHRACLRVARVLLQGMNGKPEPEILRDSLADLDRAVELQPHDPELPLVRAMAVLLGAQISKEDAPLERLAAALRDLDAVLARVDSLPARHTRGIATLLLARQEHARGRDARDLYARSIRDLEDVLQKTPDDPDVLEDLAAAYLGRAKRQLADPKRDRERAAEIQKKLASLRRREETPDKMSSSAG